MCIRHLLMTRRVAFAVLALASMNLVLTAQVDGTLFVVRDVRVFDGERVAERQSVVIRGGRIEAVGTADVVNVPPGADIVSGDGRTLLPGLIDSHVHVAAFQQGEALQQALAFGVTTVVDMWTGPPPPGFAGVPALRRLKELEALDRADFASVRTAGTGATAPGGHPTQMDGGSRANAIPTLTSPGEADAFVAARLEEGSDFIKIIHDDTNEAYGRHLPTLSAETVAAIVTAAHARGRIAVAHIGSERYARAAVASGVDGIVHLFVGASVSPDFGQFVAKQGAFVIPTFAILKHICGASDGPALMADGDILRRVKQQFRPMLSVPSPTPPRSCAAASDAVRQLVKAGAMLLAGTDSPGPGTAYGASLHRELEHLVNAGAPAVTALAAATSAPARAFRMTDRGRVGPGLRADLILVDGDPSKDIRATRAIVAIWKRGVRMP